MKDYDNFLLPVDSLEKAKDYYGNVLGLDAKFDFSNMGMTAYKVGQQEPAIILKDKSKFPDTKPIIWFVVDDVKAEYEKLKAKGVKFLSEPFEIKTRITVEFEYPFGNRLGITDYTKVADNK
ncbi:VOC family protein [Clostridium coskatii]|uniref:Glyoxalase-like domain protein n=1 Tax=Clostridium coskatii TaxID=1705578 RepID=A0A162NAS3_9CLOT|nr:VOC family protein [Clostridium coskatii]OAA91109.1 Glyoxalase-like domain protein [Clostridium coskatii]OBR90536.1 glyoxalase-like domain protein [Clostridium coskatii]